MVGEVPGEFDMLVRRLTEELTDRLHEEPDPIARIAIFGFPAQFASFKDRVVGFLNSVFEPTRYQASANLRGFYFSSGTQEGTPIDQVLGAMDRSFGAGMGALQMSGTGRSFFLHDLLTNVIFAEAGWVSLNAAAVRRANIVRYGSMAAVALVSVVALSAWGWSYASNKSLMAATDNAVSQYRVNAADFLKSDTVTGDNLKEDLVRVLGVLDSLRDMPTGYATLDYGTPLEETFGLSQRDRLSVASRAAYQQALDRMLRSRLILRLENQIEANINDPTFVYEALKVYMMMGRSTAPKVDEDLIVAWMRQDWNDNLFPGPTYKQVRDDLEQHLRAMLELDVDRDSAFDLNKPLIESAQRSLARMNMADRAYALIKSAAYSAPMEDFHVAQRAGPDASLVFETVDGSPLEDLVVPGLYTYAGFRDFFFDEAAAVADKIESEQWVMGDFGAQSAIEEQFSQLGPALLDRYGKEFVDAWTKVLDNLRFKNMSADKPQYVALSAAASPTSPITQLFEAIANETELTKEPPEGDQGLVASAANGGASTTQAAKQAVDRMTGRLSGLSRIGIDLALKKSQSRAGMAGSDYQQAMPGANIEAQFRAYEMLVQGDQGRRPIDALIQNLNEVYQSLVLSATNPSQTERANANLQVQIVNLRANASRLPKPLARMVNAAVDDFEGDAANTSAAQLNQMLASTVTRTCNDIIANRYPFAKSSRDVPMTDFARLFAPNGIIDRFFAQNLAPMVDMSGKAWAWKQDTRLGQELSNTALRDFQRAAEIRDAFFPQGGQMPNVNVTISQYSLNGGVDQALLNINSQVIQTQQVGSLPASIQWPGSMGVGAVSLSLTPEMPGRNSSITVNGPWALMRLIDAGVIGRSNDKLRVRWVIGGRDVTYEIQVASLANPFALPALSQFNCPSGL